MILQVDWCSKRHILFSNTYYSGYCILETNQQNTKNITHSKKLIAVILVAVLITATGAVLASGILTNTNSSNSQSSNQDNPQSWITVGAYATYEGQTNILMMPISFNASMEIVGINATFIQVSTTFNMTTPYGSTENTTTTWVSRENMTYQPDGLTLNSTFSAQVTLPNIGTRSCTVYEYSSQGISAEYYVDNSIQWPIEIIMSSPPVDGLSYNMDITLVDTNIPGL